MENIINAEVRTVGSKSALKKLRLNGNIPAIVYGNHKKPIPIFLNQRIFRKNFTHISESNLITLNIAGQEPRQVLIKDYIQNLIRGTIQHMDFFEIEIGKSLTTHVSISLVGISIGARQGGILEQLLHEIEIECLPKNLPETLEIDVTHLNIGESIHVSELPLLDGVEYKSSPQQVVIHVSAPKQVSLESESDDIDTENDEEPEEK